MDFYKWCELGVRRRLITSCMYFFRTVFMECHIQFNNLAWCRFAIYFKEFYAETLCFSIIVTKLEELNFCLFAGALLFLILEYEGSSFLLPFFMLNLLVFPNLL